MRESRSLASPHETTGRPIRVGAEGKDMGYYLRKSFKVGPIRLNLSRSGIGTSIGIPGMRLGVRPDGKAYIHAGRHGVYFRQQVGGTRRHTTHEPATVGGSTIAYPTASAAQIANASNSDLVDAINAMRRLPRYDWQAWLGAILSGIVLLPMSVILASNSIFLGILPLGASLTVCIVLLIFAGQVTGWERQRRRMHLNYCLEGRFCEAYQWIVSALNHLAGCQRVWAVTSSTVLSSIHERKRNAGATDLLSNDLVSVGDGVPVGIVANIPVPALRARGQMFHFFPSGILVDDYRDVGFISYGDVQVSLGSTNFIERQGAPADAQIVGWTWKHPNKDGGPDRRFADNYQVPICRYGQLVLRSTSGMCLNLITSRPDVPTLFHDDLLRFEQSLRLAAQASQQGSLNDAFKSWIEVAPEFNQTFRAFVRSRTEDVRNWTRRVMRRLDAFLRPTGGA